MSTGAGPTGFDSELAAPHDGSVEGVWVGPPLSNVGVCVPADVGKPRPEGQEPGSLDGGLRTCPLPPSCACGSRAAIVRIVDSDHCG